MKQLLAKTDALGVNSYAPNLFTFFSDTARIAELQAYAKSNLPPAAAKAVEKAVDEMSFRAEFKQRLSGEIASWDSRCATARLKHRTRRCDFSCAPRIASRSSRGEARSACCQPATGLAEEEEGHDRRSSIETDRERHTVASAAPPTKPMNVAICRLRIRPSGNQRSARRICPPSSG